jgi:hypothetical protein
MIPERRSFFSTLAGLQTMGSANKRQIKSKATAIDSVSCFVGLTLLLAVFPPGILQNKKTFLKSWRKSTVRACSVPVDETFDAHTAGNITRTRLLRVYPGKLRTRSLERLPFHDQDCGTGRGKTNDDFPVGALDLLSPIRTPSPIRLNRSATKTYARAAV